MKLAEIQRVEFFTILFGLVVSPLPGWLDMPFSQRSGDFVASEGKNHSRSRSFISLAF